MLILIFLQRFLILFSINHRAWFKRMFRGTPCKWINASKDLTMLGSLVSPNIFTVGYLEKKSIHARKFISCSFSFVIGPPKPNCISSRLGTNLKWYPPWCTCYRFEIPTYIRTEFTFVPDWEFQIGIGLSLDWRTCCFDVWIWSWLECDPSWVCWRRLLWLSVFAHVVEFWMTDLCCVCRERM